MPIFRRKTSAASFWGRWCPRPLAVIGFLHLLLSLAFAFGAPSFEKPDEPGHLDFIRFLSLNRRLPRPLPEFPFIESAFEGQQTPLYYSLQAMLLAALDSRRLAEFETEEFNTLGIYESYVASPEKAERRTLRPNPRANAFFHGTEANLFQRDRRDSFPYRYPYSVFRALRLPGILWGLLTVVVAYHLAALAFGPGSRWPVVAAAIVAFNPQFCFLAGSVSNDCMAAFMAALLTYLGCRLALDKSGASSLSRAAALGTIMGLAVLTKLSTLTLILFALACLAAPTPRRIGRLSRSAGVFLLFFFLIAGWYFIRNALLFGDPLALGTYKLTKAAILNEHSLFSSYFFSIGTYTFPVIAFESFWAVFGWMNILVDRWIILAYLAICLAGGIGLIAWLSREIFQGRSKEAPKLRLAGLLLLHAGLSLAFMIRFNLIWMQPQGRYLFGSLLPIALLIALGLRFWIERLTLPRARLRGSAPFLLAGALLALNLVCFLQMAGRY